MINFTSSGLQTSPSLKNYIESVAEKTTATEKVQKNNGTQVPIQVQQQTSEQVQQQTSIQTQPQVQTPVEAQIQPQIAKDEVVLSKNANTKQENNISNKNNITKNKKNNRNNLKNPNYRNTKSGMIMEFAFSLATLGISFFCLMKFFPKIMQKTLSNSKGDPTSITGGLKGIWEKIDNVPSLSELSLCKELSEIIGQFKNRIHNTKSVETKLGKPVKGVLLYGPPGTGKTTLAKAFAKSIDADFANLNPANINSKYFGETEKNLQAAVDHICEKASKNPNKNIVVFIDEIDAMVMDDNGSNAQHSQRILYEFKTCIETCLGAHSNIITIGATNLDINAPVGTKTINSAILSRLPEKIYVGFPTSEQIAKDILHRTSGAKKTRICDALKPNKDKEATQVLKVIAEFLANIGVGDQGRRIDPDFGVSFRTIDDLCGKATVISDLRDGDTYLEVADFYKAIEQKRNELRLTPKQLTDLKNEIEKALNSKLAL